jgi:hypothetical protein
MNRLFLRLLSLPTLVGSSLCWLTALPPARAVSEPMLQVSEPQLCVFSSHSRSNLVCERVSSLKASPQTAPVDLATELNDSPREFRFSDEESNASIALFGCDCPLCINSLRNLRSMAVS